MVNGRGNGSNATSQALQAGMRSGFAALSKELRTLTQSRGGNPPRRAQGQALARRQRQRRRALAANAALRSIPRMVLSKDERFKRGSPAVRSRFAQRGLGYYDAFVCQPEALVLGSQVGPCTPVEGFTRYLAAGHAGVLDAMYDILTGIPNPTNIAGLEPKVSDNSTLIVINCGSSDFTVGRVFKLTDDSTRTGYAKVDRSDIQITAFVEFGQASAVMHNQHPSNPNYALNIENSLDNQQGYGYVNQLDGDPQSRSDPSGRVENIPLRLSAKIRNVTEQLAVGGEVRMLRYNGGMNLGYDVMEGPGAGGVASANTNPTYLVNHSDMGVKEYMDICDMIRDSKRSYTLGGEELTTTHQSNTYPSDHVRSMTFEDDRSFVQAVREPSFCTLLILIDTFRPSTAYGGAPGNTYSIGITAQRAARFRPGTFLHSKAFAPPANQQQHGQHVRQEANNLMHALPVAGMNILKGAVGGMASQAFRKGMPMLMDMAGLAA